MNVHSVNRAGGRKVADGGRKVAGGGGNVAGGGGNVADGGRKIAGGGGNVADGGRNVADNGGKRRRGRPIVDDKRRIILDAALRVFAVKGYHGTAVPDVAETAGVGTGTLYRYFANKEALVNEVYRDAKQKLREALLGGVKDPQIEPWDDSDAEGWFYELWGRLGVFARAEPEAFRFLEMQDHVDYLDLKSRQLELSVLMPLWMAGKKLSTSYRELAAPVDTLIALLWGAFVGLVKASRLGYLSLDEKRLQQAGEACWRMLAPVKKKRSRSRSRRPS